MSRRRESRLRAFAAKLRGFLGGQQDDREFADEVQEHLQLLMRSFVALREVHLGLQADHVFQTGLALPADRYKTADQITRFLRPLLLRLKALPGVVDAAASSATPPYSGGVSKMEIAGKTRGRVAGSVSTRQRRIFPGFAN